ncbi:hypothetical protein [Hymenobacter negativus]|uniref:YtxH domain-containing protein n=1 Tax=Hymenobacter negativus TaxID=2795026 RepID=A0ABS3QBL3_9BACT|nr:hypothetical protein [Hymenobacter negativus]MBO2008557.1 hypothetical protein [Hymenobacter negativus]
MSELQNPLFEEEKEFLERKKLEYERALRGDVDHIKDQSVMVGKVALVGAGLAGSLWLISKLIGGKKRKSRKRAERDDYSDNYAADNHYEEADHDYEFGSNYYSSAKFGAHSHDDGLAHKSAADSAQAFTSHHENAHEADDLGFGSKAAGANATEFAAGADASSFDTEEFEDDPFQDLPYDDSRRLPDTHTFDDEVSAPKNSAANSRSQMVGSVLKAFLQTDTGKVLVAQAAAVAMALVTKKIGEFFPADKNADLATSPGYAPAEAGTVSVASPAPSVSSDASNPSQSV